MIIYLVIGAIAFIIYFVILQSTMKKRKRRQLNNFNNHHSGGPLTEQQKRLLSFGAILFYHRGEKILGIVPERGLDQYIFGLKQQWEISNSVEAKETLDDLLQLKRSTAFEPILKQNSVELSKIKKNISKGLGIELSEVEQTESAYAWDICRAISLAKWCYWCGYLSENETWSIMDQASKIANQFGRDWTDYTVSFLLGRTIQGFDLDDVIAESKQILHSQSPWILKIEDIDVYETYNFQML